MKDEKEFSAVKNSIQTRLSGVMLLVLIFALGINVFIFAQIHTTATLEVELTAPFIADIVQRIASVFTNREELLRNGNGA